MRQSAATTTRSAQTTFWDALPRPIVGLAPMNGITDHPFRHMQKKYGSPALLYTEFTGVERLEIGDGDLLDDFRYDESQRPIVAQIFGRTPDLFRRTAVLLCQLGFDGIDVNMGCPSPSVVHRGSGAGLIRTPELARAIVAATKAGVQEWRNGATVRDDPGVPRPIVAAVEARHACLPAHAQARRSIPVSVKTRIGYEKPEVDEWIPRLLECDPAAVAVHGRTLRQGYRGAADWDAIGRAAELARGGAPVLGNGDVATLEDAQRRSAAYGLEGVLIGRASYGDPFVFQPHAGDKGDRLRLLRIALEHARLYEECFGRRGRYHFLPMRKHLAWYARSLPSASHLRRDLVQTSSAAEAEAILRRYLARERISLS
jgi:nifR3 family TIM-barrel protein